MLSKRYPHKFDELTKFEDDEGQHRYVYLPTGQTFPKSTTGLVHAAFPSAFNAKTVIESNLSKWAGDPTSKYYALIRYLSLVKGLELREIEPEIKALWNAEGEEARTLGTEMHAALEDWMNGCVSSFGPHSYAIELVESAMKKEGSIFAKMGLAPYRTEFRVFLTSTVSHPKAPDMKFTVLNLSGTVDMLFRDKLGRLWIFDWKRISPRKKGLLGPAPASCFAKMGAGAFSNFESTDFHKYSLQLLIYKQILERGGYLEDGQEIAGMFLCQLHPEMESAHFVEAMHGMSNEDQEAFEEAANRLLDDHIQACNKKELDKIDESMNADTEDEDNECGENSDGDKHGKKRCRPVEVNPTAPHATGPLSEMEIDVDETSE